MTAAAAKKKRLSSEKTRVLGVSTKRTKRGKASKSEPAPKRSRAADRLSTARDVEHTIECPSCGAAPGAPCRPIPNAKGATSALVAGTVHPKRWRAYERALNAAADLDPSEALKWDCPTCGASRGKGCAGGEGGGTRYPHEARRVLAATAPAPAKAEPAPSVPASVSSPAAPDTLLLPMDAPEGADRACPTCGAKPGEECRTKSGLRLAMERVGAVLVPGSHAARRAAADDASSSSTSDASPELVAAVEESWATTCPECGAAPGAACSSPGGGYLESFATMHARRRALSDERIAELSPARPSASAADIARTVGCPTCAVPAGTSCVEVASAEGKRRPPASSDVSDAQAEGASAPDPFVVGARVKVLEGKYASRVGTVTRIPAGALADHRAVELDPRPRERTKKRELVRIAYLELVPLHPTCSVACTHCGAEPGAPCVLKDASGRELQKLDAGHRDRWAALGLVEKCPDCGAGVHEFCVNDGGELLHEATGGKTVSHAARRTLGLPGVERAVPTPPPEDAAACVECDSDPCTCEEQWEAERSEVEAEATREVRAGRVSASAKVHHAVSPIRNLAHPNAAACSTRIELEESTLVPASSVPATARCERQGCAQLWPEPSPNACYECGHTECPIHPDCSGCTACAAARDPEAERRADEASARMEREIEELDRGERRARAPRTTVEYDGDPGPDEPTFEREEESLVDEGDASRPPADTTARDDASAGADERVEARAATEPERIGGHEVHPVASIFPLLEDADLEALAADIAVNGQHEAIWRLPDGRILDGRNRLRACLRAGVRPTFRSYEGAIDMATLVAFVKSLNLARRHMNESQRALVAARALPLLEAEARERQRAAAAQTNARRRSDTTLPANLPEASPRSSGEARQHAARELGVSARLVQDAKTVEAHAAPEVRRAVERGDLRVSAAAELSKLDHETQRDILERSKGKPGTVRALKRQHDREQLAKELNAKPVPIAAEGPFHVIAADPSWRYDLRDSDASHRGITPYPTMTTQEICDLVVGGRRVADLGLPDSVLFLWTTNAHMDDAYDVARAWGYTPKTIGTWVKPKLGLGHYLRNRTEHFLVCVRGSPVITLGNQSNVIEAPAREHSRKPDEFFALVESLCPGSKLELFAREPRPGWARWGAETEMFER